jgi:hypothetical protein
MSAGFLIRVGMSSPTINPPPTLLDDLLGVTTDREQDFGCHPPANVDGVGSWRNPMGSEPDIPHVV